MELAEKLERIKELEAELHEQLHAHYVEVQKVHGDSAMMYDKGGESAFIVIGFNHPVNPALLPEDVDSNDKLAAIGAVSSLIAPYVTPDANGVIGVTEALPHGIQAVAASALLGSIQQGALMDTMGNAQQLVIKNTHNKRSLQ